MAKSGILHHATFHFNGHDRASVNVQFGDTATPGVPGGADMDVTIRPGSALNKAARHFGKLLAAEASKQTGVDVALHSGERADATAADAEPKAAKRTRKTQTP